MKLTDTPWFSGCGAKLGPGVLEEALCGLVQPAYPELLAASPAARTPACSASGPGLALVQTVDFFPPIVDDPRLFGRIAAANALRTSTPWAPGHHRPGPGLPPPQAAGHRPAQIDAGRGLAALVEAGCALLGGHSIEDPEPKLGYAVTGLVDPDRAWRNDTLGPEPADPHQAAWAPGW